MLATLLKIQISFALLCSCLTLFKCTNLRVTIQRQFCRRLFLIFNPFFLVSVYFEGSVDMHNLPGRRLESVHVTLLWTDIPLLCSLAKQITLNKPYNDGLFLNFR